MAERKISPREVRLIYNVKAFAILSVICAHVARPEPGLHGLPYAIGHLLSALGIIGVLSFFFLSGYLFVFSRRNSGLAVFWKKKMVSLLVPWLCCSSLVYVIVSTSGSRGSALSTLGWINFVIGNGSYLYFMSMLCVCYVLFCWVGKWNVAVWTGIGVGIASILCTSFGYLPRVNPFLNWFNWVAYFALGMLAAERHWLLPFLDRAARNKYSFYALFAGLLLLMLIVPGPLDYWVLPCLVMALCGNISIFVFSDPSRETIYSERWRDIGKKSFSIYLLHMPVAGAINILIPTVSVLALAKPLIVLFATYLGICATQRIAQLLRINGVLCSLIGCRG